MYRAFYGLREKPFNLCPDPAYLYPSGVHRKALDHLEYGLSEGLGFTMLTGEVGAGKTTLLQHIASRLGQSAETALVFNTSVSPAELLRMVLQEFELDTQGDKSALLERLNAFLIDCFARGRRVVLIIDEAQNLPSESLEEVRMLSNLQTESDPLLQIVLAGQPELAQRMRMPELAQLAQRISVSFHLTPLEEAEIGEYVAHRLRTAGAMRANLFEPGAVALIHGWSAGIPRLINNLCEACLLAGFADGLGTIGPGTVREVIEERRRAGMSLEPVDKTPPAPIPPRPVPAPQAPPAPRAMDSEEVQGLRDNVASLQDQVAQLTKMLEKSEAARQSQAAPAPSRTERPQPEAPAPTLLGCIWKRLRGLLRTG